MNLDFDYLVVGAGLFGSIFAHEANKAGKRCLVVERRNHVGGNCYTEEIEGIQVHRYGAHIFRTNDKGIWDYMGNFCEFNNFINSPIANFHGELFNLPFNMNTFNKMWNVTTPAQALKRIKEQCVALKAPARNLEEHVLNLAGRDIYEKLVKGYTEKQWGRSCSALPASIMQRIPLRFTYNNNYFNAVYQGIPIGGYTKIFDKLLKESEVLLNTDFIENRQELSAKAKVIIYTGTIDSYFNYCLGPLQYRSLRFETETLDMENYQGVAVMNFTDKETPYTRIIEHKHFEFGRQSKTVISREYPLEWNAESEPYYPINDAINQSLFQKYHKLAQKEKNVIFGGRLGEYRYYDMQDVIKAALLCAANIK